jgi:hypothetical protein
MLVDRLQAEVTTVREIAEDLNTTRTVSDVILTRLETHAMKLEIYTALVRESQDRA